MSLNQACSLNLQCLPKEVVYIHVPRSQRCLVTAFKKPNDVLLNVEIARYLLRKVREHLHSECCV